MTEKTRRLSRKTFPFLLALTASIGFVCRGTVALGEPETNSTQPQVHVFPGSVPIDAEHATQGSAPPSDAVNTDANSQNTAEQNMDAVHDPELTTVPEAAAAAEKQEASTRNQALEHYQQGTQYFGKWEFELAEVELDEAVRYMPDMKIAHRDLCLVSLARGNFPRGLAEFMMVTGLGDAIPLNENEKQELDKRAAKLHYRRALAYGKERKWNDAITELQHAIAYEPSNGAIHHSLAFAYASKGDFAKAESEYTQTFTSAPADGFAHADFANLLADKGNVQLAEDEMRKAVQLEPNAPALHVDLGWIAESRGDIPTAIQEFQTAVQLSPTHAGLWGHLGRLLEKQGNINDAMNAYSKALTLDPQEPDAKDALTRLNTAKRAGA